ncbi:MAG: VPLPA-CTERM sorting domain-containing protein [Pseudomonadota bacterium]
MRTIGLLAAIFAATAATADAATFLFLDDGTTTATIQDESVSDLSATPGVVTFSGALGAWSINVSTGLGFPFVGTADAPEIQLNSVNVSSAPGTLDVWVWETDLSPAVSMLSYDFIFGGTTQGAAEAEFCLDTTNSASTGCTTSLSSLGPFSGSGTLAFSDLDAGDIAGLTGPVAFKMRVRLEHGRAGAVTSFNAEVATKGPSVIPLPASAVMLVSAVLGLSLHRRRSG